MHGKACNRERERDSEWEKESKRETIPRGKRGKFEGFCFFNNSDYNTLVKLTINGTK